MNENLHLSPAGLDLLKSSEGYRASTYRDVAGFPTIGFGHKVCPGEKFPLGITGAEGDAILAADVLIAEASVKRLVRVELTQGQFDALVDFVFNLGAGRLASSTLLMYLNHGLYEKAAWEFHKWNHAGQKELPALTKRREAEFYLWEGLEITFNSMR